MRLEDSDKLYYIGGIVRDELIGRESFDIDLTFEGNAIEFAQNLDNAEILKINEPFGTVRVKINDKIIDIASTRSEIYEKPGHLPVVTKIGCSLKDDVIRRDFTINSLAKNFKTGEIIDYTNGLDDIKNKKLRILHDKSFIEDPTRIIRALKFAVRFGFSLDEYSKILCREYLCDVNYDMSYKRIKKELIETFNLNSQAAYDLFMDNGVYRLITPVLQQKANISIENLVKKYNNIINPDNIWLIYVGTLSDLSRLAAAFTKNEKKILDDYMSVKSKIFNSDFEIYKTFEKFMPETILLYAITGRTEQAQKYLDNLSKIKIKISGQDLKEMGITPSKKYSLCFDYILKNKLNNPDLSYEEEFVLAKKFFSHN